MNNKIVLGMATLCLSGIIGFAEPVPIRWEPPEGNEWTETPVTGDYDKSSGDLALKFSESSTYTVAVYGEGGIVFSSIVNVNTYEEVRINVGSYRDNEVYTIVVTDDKGNRYEGDFFA